MKKEKGQCECGKTILLKNLTIILMFVCIVMITYRIGMFDGEYSGIYYKYFDIFTVKGNGDVKSMMETCAHEVAHQIYYTKLTEDEIKQWELIHNQSVYNRLNKTGFVSDYSTKNPREDFAESFRQSMRFSYDETDLATININKSRFINKLFWRGAFNER